MRRPHLQAGKRDFFSWGRWTLLAMTVAIVMLGAPLGTDPRLSDALAGERPIKTAPDFSTFDVDGNSRALSNYLQARPILLEFMSPDCPHCAEMAPILTRVHTVYGDKVQFLTVAFDKNVSRVQRFSQLEKHTWPYLMGTQQIINAYKLEGVPTFYFLMPDATMINMVVGSVPESAVRENLENLLKAK